MDKIGSHWVKKQNDHAEPTKVTGKKKEEQSIRLYIIFIRHMIDIDSLKVWITHHLFKVILYSYLILKKMNELITDS